MKLSKLIYLVLTLNLVFCFGVFAQNITITDDDAYTPDNAAILDVKSTLKGVLLPRLTDDQRDALYRNVPQGMLIFNTTDSALQISIDTSWYTLNMVTPEIAPEEPLTDYDGNVYQTVVIGNQEWMAENLRTTHYADGTALVDGVAAGDITGDYTSEYYFWYNNDSASNAEIYGALYTWAAMMHGSSSSSSNPSGIQGACPTGWHVPGDAEWTELTDYLTNNAYGYEGSGTDIGKSMASTSGWTTHGTAGNVGNDQASNNSSGFLALPGGYRYTNGSFLTLGYDAYFWSATEYDASRAWHRYLYYNHSEVYRSSYDDKSYGFSARCLKD